MKYKIEDRVKVKSLDWYNKNKDSFGYVNFFSEDMVEYCGSIATIVAIDNKYNRYKLDIDDCAWWWSDDMFEEIMEDEISFDTEYEWKHEFNCPDGYQFVDENGNVINATKIVLEKKKKEYPKTYEECCQYLGCDDKIKMELIGQFIRLINARNAYWKIAGEEMGLGKAWEPDWSNGLNKSCILNCENRIIKSAIASANLILAFPTEEMRDAFYENFKELIEQCKELL